MLEAVLAADTGHHKQHCSAACTRCLQAAAALRSGPDIPDILQARFPVRSHPPVLVPAAGMTHQLQIEIYDTSPGIPPLG